MHPLFRVCKYEKVFQCDLYCDVIVDVTLGFECSRSLVAGIGAKADENGHLMFGGT